MSDDRRVDDLSLEELIAIVDERRRLERAKEFAESSPYDRFHPITVEPKEKAKSRRRANRSWGDTVLLLVELAAVLGLVAVIVSSLGTLQALNREAVQVQAAIKSPAVQGITSNAQLPGSSFPPGSSTLPQDPPPALGLAVQNVPVLPPPTAGPQSPTRIVISKIGVDWPIVEGDGWEQLMQGVGHHAGSANPGERGNVVLTGHDDVYGEVFRDLDKLENDDLVVLYAGGHSYRYAVRAKRVVAPSELSVMNPTRDPIVTLITCTPYRVDTMRLTVVGVLVP